MNQGLKKNIENSTTSFIKIYRNCKIKVIQKPLLLSLLFIGAFPLHADATKLPEIKPEEGIVAIHFGPGDADIIAIVESNEEINSFDTINSEISEIKSDGI